MLKDKDIEFHKIEINEADKDFIERYERIMDTIFNMSHYINFPNEEKLPEKKIKNRFELMDFEE